MAQAAQFFAPDLTGTGILAKAATKYGWSAGDTKVAHDWYNHFLEANWNANGASVGVMNRKADDLWHVHIDSGPEYTKYCNDCFGRYLDHIPVDSRHKATKAELDAVQPLYVPNWPIPDSIVSCHS